MLSPSLELQELNRWHQMPIKSLYGQLYRILVACLNDKTRELTIEFSGAFARLDYLCREIKYKETHPQAYRQICAFRSRCTHLASYSSEELSRLYGFDMRAMCEFLSSLYDQIVPKDLAGYLTIDYPEIQTKNTISNVLRCSVAEINADYILLIGPLGEDFIMPWQYEINDKEFCDLEYLRRMLKIGTQLNLIHPWEVDGLLRAERVIYEPDLLIDISTIAGCFELSGPSPYHYLIKLLDNSPRNSSQLLGNLAGQMLDEEIHFLDQDKSVTYTESLKRFFAENALSVVSCSEFQIPDLLRKFHEQAREQQQNLRQIVKKTFAEDRTIDLQKVVLEPSFYCEMLGLQGRMDLLQSDKHVLMEQKSGKMDEYRHTHQQKHFVQILLYQAMLHYAYKDDEDRVLRNDDIASYLLYSRYPEGLLKEAPAPRLLESALKLRNQIAHLQLLLSRGEAEYLFSHLTPEVFNVIGCTGRIWEEFIRPRLQQILDKIQKADSVERAYFYRMFTFVSREHILSKMGTSQKEASGFAALWNSTSAEKREAGDLIDQLQITDIADDKQTLTLLSMQEEGDNEIMLPNFRIGDIVVLYAYSSTQEPDARRDFIFRASIVEMSGSSIVLRLRGLQRNLSLFHPKGDELWAIEHDFMESSYGGLYRGLYALLEATIDRRALLLGQREPRVDSSLSLVGDYGKFNDLVLKFKQAQDFFLLIGPPGTGKTSYGLVNILKEQILTGEGQSNILLVSYTNRAVDEICSKLLKMGVPFLRIGNELSCPPEYHEYLLSVRCKLYHTAQEIRNMIQGCRVVVGTTTSMTSGISLFELKQFDLCIIDEASQILEPHLLALLSARHGEEDAIQKFVMIGDHKQLPAVVQQQENDSKVTSEPLNNIGLYDCRQSLFERLLRLHPVSSGSPLVHTLKAQGRMHHEIAMFANESFYGGELCEVPLEHQLRPIPYRTDSLNPLLNLLTTKRMSFIDIRKERNEESFVSDKVNLQEAQKISELVYAVWQLWEENGLEFDSNESVGVIVPYRHQIATIRKELEKYHIPSLFNITIDTVERYQGSQRDVIIYGFTISKPYQLDFLTNNCFVEEGQLIDRKLNVAMTRAREVMVFLGDTTLLQQNKIFERLITYCRSTL